MIASSPSGPGRRWSRPVIVTGRCWRSSESAVRTGFCSVAKILSFASRPRKNSLGANQRARLRSHRFAVVAGPDVTLSEDLGRRDLTINAMAQGADGQLIDPYGGEADIAAGCLRHVSNAFIEDPLRVFRVARFAAQLPGFHVAPETQVLLEKMCEGGELVTLSAERVWQEFVKALAAPQPHRFFEVLQSCQGLSDWRQNVGLCRYPNGHCTGQNRWSVMPLLPLSADDIQALAARLLAPKAYLQAALDRIAYLSLLSDPELMQGVLFPGSEQLKALHDAQRLIRIMQLMESSALRQRRERELLPLVAELKTLALPKDTAATLKGAAFGEALTQLRVQRLAERLAVL